MEMLVAQLGAASAAGLAASAHCATMCGPLALTACTSAGRVSGRASGAYAVGRLVSYAVTGALAGSLGARVVRGLGPDRLREAAALSVAVGVAMAAVRIWRAGGRSTVPSAGLVPLRTRRDVVPLRSLSLGLVNGLLPCGALVSGLFIAAGTASPLVGALAMTAFSLGTTPGLVAAVMAGSAVGRILPRAHARTQRRMLGAVLMAVAVWLAARPWLPHRACHCHDQHAVLMHGGGVRPATVEALT